MADLSTSARPYNTSPEPSDLAVAARVAQLLLAEYEGIDHSDLLALDRAYAGLCETLRILLRHIGVEQAPVITGRCPAAHPEDPTPCTGRSVVTVLDAQNAGANGCEHHAARLLASLQGARVYALPDTPAGAAIRVFKAADGIRPFPWLSDAPRTQSSQLSHAENRGGEGR